MNKQVLGLDLHKNQSYITVMGQDGQILAEKNYKTKDLALEIGNPFRNAG